MAGKLDGKVVAMIVANEFEDVELLYPILRLSEEGATIVVVPVHKGDHPRPFIERKEVTGRFGHTVPLRVMEEGRRYIIKDIEEVSADDIDCVFFPGGFSPDALRLHEPTLKLVRDCDAKGTIVSAICHGGWVLISAGVAAGRQATCYAAVRDDMVNAGAKFSDVPVIVDGNLITGRQPDDLPELCQALTVALSE